MRVCKKICLGKIANGNLFQLNKIKKAIKLSLAGVSESWSVVNILKGILIFFISVEVVLAGSGYNHVSYHPSGDGVAFNATLNWNIQTCPGGFAVNIGERDKWVAWEYIQYQGKKYYPGDAIVTGRATGDKPLPSKLESPIYAISGEVFQNSRSLNDFSESPIVRHSSGCFSGSMSTKAQNAFKASFADPKEARKNITSFSLGNFEVVQISGWRALLQGLKNRVSEVARQEAEKQRKIKKQQELQRRQAKLDLQQRKQDRRQAAKNAADNARRASSNTSSNTYQQETSWQRAEQRRQAEKRRRQELDRERDAAIGQAIDGYLAAGGDPDTLAAAMLMVPVVYVAAVVLMEPLDDATSASGKQDVGFSADYSVGVLAAVGVGGVAMFNFADKMKGRSDHVSILHNSVDFNLSPYHKVESGSGELSGFQLSFGRSFERGIVWTDFFSYSSDEKIVLQVTNDDNPIEFESSSYMGFSAGFGFNFSPRDDLTVSLGIMPFRFAKFGDLPDVRFFSLTASLDAYENKKEPDFLTPVGGLRMEVVSKELPLRVTARYSSDQGLFSMGLGYEY